MTKKLFNDTQATKVKVSLRGSAKMIFLESLINGEQDKRNLESDLSFPSNSLLKSSAFGSRPRKQNPGNELLVMTSKEELMPTGLSRFQLFTRTE